MVNMNNNNNTSLQRQEHHDKPTSQKHSQPDEDKKLGQTIFLGMVASFVFWLMLSANEGAATMYPEVGIFFPVIGGGLGVCVGIPWARRVSSWKKFMTFMVTGLLGAALWGLVSQGLLMAPIAAVLTGAMLSLMRLRWLGLIRWPW